MRSASSPPLVISATLFLVLGLVGPRSLAAPGRERSRKVSKVRDGAPMVLVAAGRFLRGSRPGDWGHDSQPQRRIYVGAFYIDKHEVTVAQYRRCVAAGGCSADLLETDHRTGQTSTLCNWGRRGGTHPINCVDWKQAQGYCRWVGKRLPTEAEWEKAARGADGRKYPWGSAPPTCDRAILSSGRRIKDAGCGKKSTWPVGSRSPAGDSPYGAQDMAGNVYEWTADWYAESYYRTSPSRNPAGPSTGTRRVKRGGGWGLSAGFLGVALRQGLAPTKRDPHLGFRCARKR